jgi:hypothetical protein
MDNLIGNRPPTDDITVLAIHRVASGTGT